MNIAYVCADRGVPVLGHKGASVHVREFVTALAALGHEVTLLCANLGTGNALPPVRVIELAPDASPAAIAETKVRLGPRNRDADPLLRRELGVLAADSRLAARVVASLDDAGVRPEALYQRYALFHRAGEQVAQTLGIPHILEVNAPLAEEQERFRGLRLKELAEEAETQTFRHADHVVAVSAAVRERVLARGVPEERVTVLPNGVDTARFHSVVSGRTIRERYGMNGKPVIGLVSSLKPWHGLDFLLDSFEEISAAHPGALLLIAGDGPGMADLQARVARENLDGRVILAGHVPHAEIPCYLAATDLTVAPYIPQDGFYFSPLKIVESLAVGRPVVAPELGQIADLIQDGVTGLLFPPGDREAFSRQVVSLLSNPPRLQAMGRAAAAIAATEFSWQKNARRVVERMTQLSQARIHP